MWAPTSVDVCPRMRLKTVSAEKKDMSCSKWRKDAGKYEHMIKTCDACDGTKVKISSLTHFLIEKEKKQPSLRSMWT